MEGRLHFGQLGGAFQLPHPDAGPAQQALELCRLPPKFLRAHAAAHLVLAAKDERIAGGERRAGEQVLGKIQLGIGEEPGARHFIPIDEIGC